MARLCCAVEVMKERSYCFDCGGRFSVCCGSPRDFSSWGSGKTFLVCFCDPLNSLLTTPSFDHRERGCIFDSCFSRRLAYWRGLTMRPAVVLMFVQGFTLGPIVRGLALGSCVFVLFGVQCWCFLFPSSRNSFLVRLVSSLGL